MLPVCLLQVQEQLCRERENYSALHDQHMQLRRQQEVLAAELMVALGSYKPKANIDAGWCPSCRFSVLLRSGVIPHSLLLGPCTALSQQLRPPA